MWKKTDENNPAFDAPSGAGADAGEAPKSSPPAPSPTAAPQQRGTARQAASIGPSIKIRGDITGEEDLVVHGQIEGTLNLPANDITVGADGQVKADLKATRITVEGQVVGDLQGSERVIIKQSGRVEGNISAPRVMLEDGCRFKGSVEMNIGTDSSAAQLGGKKPGEQQRVTDMASGDKVVRASSGT